MNFFKTWLAALLFVIAPVAATAQSNIQSAFDALIKCPEAKVVENHTLDKDPVTNVKTGQCDIYSFELPAKKINLVDNILKAFEDDREKAYSYYRGKYQPGNSPLGLAIGDGVLSVQVTDDNAEYAQSLFLAPKSEDPKGIYRYAYAISYKEEDGKLKGRLIITYATTLSYRQQFALEQQQEAFRNLTNDADESRHSLFGDVMSNLLRIRSVSSQTRIKLATRAFEILRKRSEYPDLNSQDIDAIREILKVMIADKEYSEPMLHTILNQCLTILR